MKKTNKKHGEKKERKKREYLEENLMLFIWILHASKRALAPPSQGLRRLLSIKSTLAKPSNKNKKG